MNFVSLEDVKNYLGIDHPDEDYLITRLISSAEEFAEKYCNRKFGIKDYIDVFSGNNLDYHMTKEWPVISVTDSKLKAWDGRKVYINGIFEKGSMNCSLSYQAGYEFLPQDIQQAIIELVAHYYKQKDNIGLSSKNMGTETTTFIVKSIPDFIALKLRPYRRVL